VTARSATWRAAPLALLLAAGASAQGGGGAPGAAPDPATPAVAAAPEPAAGRDRAPFGFEGWRSDAPFSIESESLDVRDEAGLRRLVFSDRVRARRGDLSLEAAQLVAVYPAGASQPDRLEARGDVRFVQGGQSARCDSALYDRVRDHVTCRGNARFRDGGSELAGQVIEIDLGRETVKVHGGASLVIEPKAEEGAP
jgi:lipopolysaccharide transport protein LptA